MAEDEPEIIEREDLPINTARDLASWLKKDLIPATKIRVGDMVIESTGRVYRVNKTEELEGRIGIYDALENGCRYLPDSEIAIIPRRFIAKEPYKY